MQVGYKAIEIVPKHHEPQKDLQSVKDVLKIFNNMRQQHELPRYRWNMKVGYKGSEIVRKHHEPQKPLQSMKDVLKIFDNMR